MTLPGKGLTRTPEARKETKMRMRAKEALEAIITAIDNVVVFLKHSKDKNFGCFRFFLHKNSPTL